VKTLLLHPEDSPRRGPWTLQKWDQIVDLGKSSEATAASWQELAGCPVLRLESFRRSVEDPRLVGEILRSGFGQVRDELGLDWWELTSLFVHADLETAVLLLRLAASKNINGELYASRPDWPVRGLAALLGRSVRALANPDSGALLSLVRHYGRVYKRFTPAQIIEIFWDKYDPGYAWRSKWTLRPPRASTPVVLLPSAYTNVSRMAAAYSRLLPDQPFLLVATRRSGLQFDPPSNVSVARLAAYARPVRRHPEYAAIVEKWTLLRKRLNEIRELALLDRVGILDRCADWFEHGLSARDAWVSVLDREAVMAVLCGDDTNWYTRLPVLLARRRGLPTVDFHHGAFDGRFLLKDLSSDVYLAKSEMERDYLLCICRLPADRVIIGAPPGAAPLACAIQKTSESSIVFFSEPAESAGGRPEEIYRELIPPLFRLASEHGRTLVVKLHPFENSAERSKLLASVLSSEERAKLKIVSGPLSPELLATTWFGITVESSTVVDCTRHSVPCFFCEWLAFTPYGYTQQYARFGIGHSLRSANELTEIPRILSETPPPLGEDGGGEQPIGGDTLQRLFAGRSTIVSK
jgi:hypothetical protein